MNHGISAPLKTVSADLSRWRHLASIISPVTALVAVKDILATRPQYAHGDPNPITTIRKSWEIISTTREIYRRVLTQLTLHVTAENPLNAHASWKAVFRFCNAFVILLTTQQLNS